MEGPRLQEEEEVGLPLKRGERKKEVDRDLSATQNFLFREAALLRGRFWIHHVRRFPLFDPRSLFSFPPGPASRELVSPGAGAEAPKRSKRPLQKEVRVLSGVNLLSLLCGVR